MALICNGSQIRGDGRSVTLGLAAKTNSLVRTKGQSDVTAVTLNVSQTTTQDAESCFKSARAEDSEQQGIRPCGAPHCRVCIALGFTARPEPPVRLPGSHHPLSTPRALARAERVLEALRSYQREHGHPPGSLREITSDSGFARSGLLSRYMQLLELQGRVRRAPVDKKRGRARYCWEAVPE